jgi:hypothetical protein
LAPKYTATYDAEFNRMLENENSAVRKIGVNPCASPKRKAASALHVVDEDGHDLHGTIMETPKEPAKNTEGLLENIKKNLSQNRQYALYRG